MSDSNQHSELVDAIEAGFDRHFAADLYVPEAREALARLVEQMEALQEKLNQPLLNAARRLVKATDNAERNYALADLVVALEHNSNPAKRPT